MRTITITLRENSGTVSIEVSSVPPTPFNERMTHPVERVAKSMLDIAADLFGIVAHEAKPVGGEEGITSHD